MCRPALFAYMIARAVVSVMLRSSGRVGRPGRRIDFSELKQKCAQPAAGVQNGVS